MSSMEVTKASAAVLLAGIAFLGSQLIADALVKPKPLEHVAIKIDLPQKGAPAAATAAAPEEPIAVLLASADAGRGEAGVKSQGCVACHNFNEGGKAGVGPNLYGVMGAPHGNMEGYAYSAVLKAKTGPWTFDEMNDWLRKPSAYAPGTKMSYAGLADQKKRADIIAYLRTLSHDPLPLPAAPAQSASATPAVARVAGAAPAAGAPVAGAQTAAAQAPATPPAGAAPAVAAENNSVVLLAAANPDAGKSATARLGCVACHSLNEGGKNGLGPNLYGVVGAQQGGHSEGYAYSAALKAKGGKWDYAELDKWLLKPSAYAPGTKMSYAGITDPKVRADVISYLRSLSADPLPLPN